MRKRPDTTAAAAEKLSSRTYTKHLTVFFGASDIAVALIGIAMGFSGTADLVRELGFLQAVFLITYQTVGVLDHRISKNLDGITSLVSAIIGRRRPDA
jgi:hypothetical protein